MKIKDDRSLFLFAVFFTIIVGLILAYIGYTEKNAEVILTSLNTLIILPILFLILDIIFSLSKFKYFKFFSFFAGFFNFKGESDDFIVSSKVIGGELAVFAIFIAFFIPYGLYQFIIFLDPQSLIIPSLSLILAGAALSTLSFNHSNSIDYDKGVMLAGAKRFYMSTIYAIITIFFTITLVILSKWIFAISSSTLSTSITLQPFEFSLV